MAARHPFVRNSEGLSLLLKVLICAVATVLGVRFYLHLTGYPQIGGGGLHIAHMLWGGFMMLVALVLLLGYLGRRPQRLGAIVGGIGFGLFIDELGKFITRDNNYFFQPTVALIYVIFVLLAIAIQLLERTEVFSDAERRANALRAIEDAMLFGQTPERSARLHRHLVHAQEGDQVWEAIEQLADVVGEAPARRSSVRRRAERIMRERYRDLSAQAWFLPALTVVFLVHAAFMVGNAVGRLGVLEGQPNLTFAPLGELLTALASALCAVASVVALPRSRLVAYELFKLSLLIALLTTQFFVFIAAQFAAVPGFVVNGVLLLAVTNLAHQEQTLRHEDGNTMANAQPRGTTRSSV